MPAYEFPPRLIGCRHPMARQDNMPGGGSRKTEQSGEHAFAVIASEAKQSRASLALRSRLPRPKIPAPCDSRNERECRWPGCPVAQEVRLSYAAASQRQESPMQDLDENSVTEAALAQMAEYARSTPEGDHGCGGAPPARLRSRSKADASRVADRHPVLHRGGPGLHTVPPGVHPAGRCAGPQRAGQRDARQAGA